MNTTCVSIVRRNRFAENIKRKASLSLFNVNSACSRIKQQSKNNTTFAIHFTSHTRLLFFIAGKTYKFINDRFLDLRRSFNSQFWTSSIPTVAHYQGRRRRNTWRITRGFLRATYAISPRYKPPSRLGLQPHSRLQPLDDVAPCHSHSLVRALTKTSN